VSTHFGRAQTSMVRFADGKFDLTLLRDGLTSRPGPPLTRGGRFDAHLGALELGRAPWCHDQSAPPALTETTAPSARAKVASYPTLEQAHQAVDVLSKEGLPTRHVSVVDEARQAAPALTYKRAASHGAAAGAWVGLALGFLSGVVKIGAWHTHALALGEGAAHPTPFLSLALLCALVGALIGAALGALTHAIAGAASESEAGDAAPPAQYDVLVDAEHAEGARTLLWLAGP
jgi:heat induced stress protein YflT